MDNWRGEIREKSRSSLAERCFSQNITLAHSEILAYTFVTSAKIRAPLRFRFMPFYSIVIPVFNRETLVGATLDSVFAQSETDWEIILVDDGSNDDTWAVLEAYRAQQSEKIRLIHCSNGGPGAARNVGVAASNGRYLAFLDSDDFWFPWTLEFYRQQLEKHAFPSFLVGEPLIFQSDARWQEAVRFSPKLPQQNAKIGIYRDYLQAELTTDWLSTSSFVVRRDILKDVKFCARPINCEDIDFTLQIATKPGFIKIQSPPTFGYRQHEGGITKCYLRTVQGIEFLIHSELSGRYPGAPKRRRQRLRILGRHVRPALLEFLERGYRRRAWRALKRTLKWHLELGRVRFLLGFLLRAMQPRRRAWARNSKRSRSVEKNSRN